MMEKTTRIWISRDGSRSDRDKAFFGKVSQNGTPRTLFMKEKRTK